MKYILATVTFILLGWLVLAPATTQAAEVTVRPFFVDHTLTPGESITEQIKITSQANPNRKSTIFTTVNEITVGTSGEIKEFTSATDLDRTSAITSWIEISRGAIDLLGGESTEIPITVTVHPYAKPGEYHAFIGFVDTTKRHLAESVALSGAADGLILKITVVDERTESMKITSTVVERIINKPEQEQISVTVVNHGDVASAPTGEVIFYNNRGFEVDSKHINDAGSTIAPGDEQIFTVAIPVTEVGKFKANVQLNYGSQLASLSDSVTFFFIPVWLMVLIGVALLALAVGLALLFRRASQFAGIPEQGEDVTMFIKDSHEANPKDHDIDLKNNQ